MDERPAQPWPALVRNAGRHFKKAHLCANIFAARSNDQASIGQQAGTEPECLLTVTLLSAAIVIKPKVKPDEMQDDVMPCAGIGRGGWGTCPQAERRGLGKLRIALSRRAGCSDEVDTSGFSFFFERQAAGSTRGCNTAQVRLVFSGFDGAAFGCASLGRRRSPRLF